jgi:hypothetical protein
MTRELTGHKVNGANEQLTITVADEPGSGGASHRYDIGGFNVRNNSSSSQSQEPGAGLEVVFQNGPIGEVGANGVTHEALIAILIDRLEGFQAGPFSNCHNAIALHHLRLCQETLLDRTRERIARGVEGTHNI